MSTATNRIQASANPNATVGDQSQTYFSQQRALLVNEIAQSLDNFLTQLNRLNRNLESVIAVGNEFSSVEALWSQFETVMGPQLKDEQSLPENSAEVIENQQDAEEGTEGGDDG